MPSKHIEDELWRRVEKRTVEAVIDTKESIKDTTMLQWLVKVGLKNITNEDIKEFVNESNGKKKT